jgi:hypothetical protein
MRAPAGSVVVVCPSISPSTENPASETPGPLAAMTRHGKAREDGVAVGLDVEVGIAVTLGVDVAAGLDVA